LSTDLAERNDVAATQPEVVEAIREAIRDYHAGMPD